MSGSWGACPKISSGGGLACPFPDGNWARETQLWTQSYKNESIPMKVRRILSRNSKSLKNHLILQIDNISHLRIFEYYFLKGYNSTSKFLLCNLAYSMNHKAMTPLFSWSLISFSSFQQGYCVLEIFDQARFLSKF